MQLARAASMNRKPNGARTPAREYVADADGARILGDPLPLASALAKLEHGVRLAPAEIRPATAHLYGESFTPSPLTR